MSGTSVRSIPRHTHTSAMALGGFETVELNAAGWAVAIGPAAVISGAVGFLASRSGALTVVGAAAGAVAGFGVARLWDARRSDRQWTNVAVRTPDSAISLLRSSGVPASSTVTEVEGTGIHYVTVRIRDHARAEMIAGLPSESTRARRRARSAARIVQELPKRKPIV